ncbi:conserved Plasmodium protein, unknown function [Plasmodium malariae]|uniref:Dolichyl-diphosphooligosaccharide--protein glycosyltransferase subunit 2 n=1 Tax=Plasmodium malariae TaxID=5858 RepID=A0A1C3KDI7_PLAMA|nr:conserved Plasmodium protein, unknown function [Plasmodium malariae]
MNIVFLIFLFILVSMVTEGRDDLVNIEKSDNFFLVLSKIKITGSKYLNDKKEQRDILMKVIDEEKNVGGNSDIYAENNEEKNTAKSMDINSYIILDEQVSLYDMLTISCTFKVNKEFDKSKLIVLLVKELIGDRSSLHMSNTIEDLKKDETFVFSNTFEDNFVVSTLSLLFVNLIAINGFYNLDIYISDGGKYTTKIYFLKIYLKFYNNLPVVSYPIRKNKNRIISNIMQKQLITYDTLHINNSKYVLYDYKDYYAFPIIMEKDNIMFYASKKNGINKTKKLFICIIPIILVIMILLSFLMCTYFIFHLFKYNIKNIRTSYFNYAFLFSFISIMFTFILYDLFFNILQIYRIFIFLFTLFLLFFYKALKILREYRKCAQRG